MTIIRIAKGTASDKGAGLTLTIPDLELAGDGSALVVGLAYEASDGPPIVRWGQQRIEPIVTQAGGGVVCRVGVYLRQAGTRTNDLVATWTGSAPTAKAMFATEITEAAIPDLVLSQFEASTGDPTAGTEDTPTEDAEFYLGVFASEGPLTDVVGTIENAYEDGQRAGTTGGGPASNVTVHEIFKIVETAELTAAAKTGEATRDVCSCLVTFRISRRNRQGISGGADLQTMRDIFNSETPPLRRREHAFHHNARTDEWEIFEVEDMPSEPSAANVRRIARYDRIEGWVVLI